MLLGPSATSSAIQWPVLPLKLYTIHQSMSLDATDWHTPVLASHVQAWDLACSHNADGEGSAVLVPSSLTLIYSVAEYSVLQFCRHTHACDMQHSAL